MNIGFPIFCIWPIFTQKGYLSVKFVNNFTVRQLLHAWIFKVTNWGKSNFLQDTYFAHGSPDLAHHWRFFAPLGNPLGSDMVLPVPLKSVIPNLVASLVLKLGIAFSFILKICFHACHNHLVPATGNSIE